MKTRGTGIQVFPVLSLLSWGQSPPAGAADLTILGETSAQAAARWQQLEALNQAAHHGMWGENAADGVTPGSPDVAVCPQGHYVGKANTDVANFSTDSFSIGQVSRRLEDQWRQFRNGAGLALLRALWQTANPPGTPAAARRVILVEQRRRGQGGNDASGHTVSPPGGYGSWGTPDKPLPTLHTSGEDGEMGGPPRPVAAAETRRRRSRGWSTPP